MAQPNRLGRIARADDLFAQDLVFRAAWRFVWKTLGRYRLGHADRMDVAQIAVIAAWQGRHGYRAERGSPEQWLSRIAHNAAAAFLRRSRTDPLALAGDDLGSAPEEGPVPEERMLICDIADRVFEALPNDERRAVVAVAIEGLTLREVALREGASPSTIHDRYQRGIAALRAAFERDGHKAFALPLPFDLVDLDGPAGDSEPPPELLEEAWRRAVEELGLDGSPDSEPPPSGTRRRAIKPEPREKRRWLRLVVGPFGGAVVGALIGASAVRGCQHDVPRVEAAVSAPEATPVAALIAPVAAPLPSASAPVAVASMPAAVNARRTSTTTIIHPPPASTFRDPHDEERALFDNARAAIASGEPRAALAALDKLTHDFPDSQDAAGRARLLANLCAVSTEPELDRRCGRAP